MEVKLQRVKSSNVKALGWVDDKMYVLFNSGLYVYNGVKPEDYQHLLAAQSIGKSLRENFIGKYGYKRLPLTEELKALDNPNVESVLYKGE